MSCAMRRCRPSESVFHKGLVGSLVALTVSLAGCSADISRFGPGLSLSNNDNPRQSTPLPAEPMRRGVGAPVDNEPAFDRQAAPPPAQIPPREPEVRMSGLPEPAPRPEAAPLAPPVTRTRPTPPPVSPVATRPAPAVAAAPGNTIEVKPGDTLYGIAKRHRVAISELMTLNNLQNPALKPGQKLVLPAGKRAVQPRTASPETAPAPAPTVRSSTPPAPMVKQAAPAPSEWHGTHTVAPGDSLYAIARKYKVKAAELQSVNGITDPTKVRPGTVLKVPGPAGSHPVAAAPPATPAKPVPDTPETQPLTGGPRPAGTSPPLKRVAEANPGTQTDTPPTAAEPPPPKATAGTSKFRWPVKGKIIAGFGPRPDGTHNDGVNISVPAGTEVLAVENGVVAYAGSELKGYGNLVLIRHQNGWVSAYAHNDTLLVKRGDKIKRGQTIANAGTSGAVDQPQVHFELRQGSKPVDPMPHMEPH